MSGSNPPESRTLLVLLALTSAVLLATAFFHLFFLMPVFRALMASYAATFSAPTRVAFAIADFWLPLGGLGGAVIGLYVWYRKEPGRMGRLRTALAVTGLVLAIYLALLPCAYYDVAISLPSFHSR